MGLNWTLGSDLLVSTLAFYVVWRWGTFLTAMLRSLPPCTTDACPVNAQHSRCIV